MLVSLQNHLNFDGRVGDADALDGVWHLEPDGVAQREADDDHVADVVDEEIQPTLKRIMVG